MSAISLPPPPRAASSANPPTTGEHYAALSALHSHYRALVASERKTMVQERQLWEDERTLYIRRIEELENAVRTSAAPPAPPKQPVEWSPPAHQPATREWAPPPFPTGPTGPTTTTTTAGAGTNAAPAAISAAAPQQENSRPAPSSSVSAPAAVSTNNSNRNNSADNKPALALDDNDDDEEEEISPEEMAQLLREATRIVYPISQVRPRGRSLAEPAHRRAHAPVESEAEDGSGEEEVELKLKKTSNFGMDFGKMDFGRWR